MQKARSHQLALAPTACKRMVSGTFSLPCPGCFSPFPHGTGSLSVSWEYLALADGPAGFPQGFSCPAVLRVPHSLAVLKNTGLSPSVAGLSRPFQYRIQYHLQALPISLAATFRISVDFFSCSYLDVSVRCVRLLKLCIHFKIPLRVSSLIRTSVDQCSLASSPELFAGLHVLLRL